MTPPLRAAALALLLASLACASDTKAESSPASGSITLPAKGNVEALAFAPGDISASFAFVHAPGDRVVVLRSDHGGEWNRVGLLDRAGQVFGAVFEDNSNGVLLHGDLNLALLYRTRDGGATWTEIARSLGRFVRLEKDEHGGLLLLGARGEEGGTVLALMDGARLEPVIVFDGDSPLLVSDLARFRGRTFLVGGRAGRGTLYASDDGRRFARLDIGEIPNLLSIAFDERGVGLAVGSRGEALRSLDGGATWKPTLSGTDRDLASVCFVGEGRALACGEEGTILATRDGGASFHPIDLGRRDDFIRLMPSGDGAYVLGARGAVPFVRVP